jgi:hypothetical protein
VTIRSTPIADRVDLDGANAAVIEIDRASELVKTVAEAAAFE